MGEWVEWKDERMNKWMNEWMNTCVNESVPHIPPTRYRTVNTKTHIYTFQYLIIITFPKHLIEKIMIKK